MENWESRLLSMGDVGATERIGAIVGLVSEWRGPVIGAEAIPAFVPEVLWRFYAAVGGSLESVCRQNRILAPTELRVIGGKLEFAVENQVVFSWSVDLSKPDPPVYSRFGESNHWIIDVPALSLFLAQFMLFELLIAAPFGASAAWLTRTEIDVALSCMRELPWPHWHCPSYPGRFFVRGNAFAFCCPNRGPDDVGGDPQYSFWLGGKDVSDVEFITSLIGVAWEFVSVERSD